MQLQKKKTPIKTDLKPLFSTDVYKMLKSQVSLLFQISNPEEESSRECSKNIEQPAFL